MLAIPKTLAELRLWIMERYQNQFHNHDVTTGIVRELGPDWPQFFLRNVLEQTESFEAIRSQSFLHTTGVFKIILFRIDNSHPELRIHIWPENYKLTFPYRDFSKCGG